MAHQAPFTDSADTHVLDRTLQVLAEVQSAIRAGDMPAIQQKGTALKGFLTSALAKAAFEASSALEQTQHENDLARAQDVCRRLRKAINILKQTAADQAEEPR